ncbi:MAG: hypothetical protein A3C47_06100 [Omnitrophica bacterium RIFCSPHIGHO2_02_FULL_51_18]|nr:MAG: hypothetical protein A3C47_06100 [Omnitrophica bacterium RIFCSPHIGHO2_02_FULL_51_18]
MKVILSVPGKWHLFQVARELEKRGLLHRIYTSFPKFKVYPKEGIPKDKLKCLPLGEACMQIAKRLPGKQRSLAGNLLWMLKNDFFDREVAARLRRQEPGFVYHGLSSAQSRSLRRAKDAGMKTILERSSTHVLFQNKIMEEEYKKFGVPIRDHQPDWLVRNELREYEIADKILVPTHFVKKTFMDEGVDEKKILVIPFGTNLDTGRLSAQPKKNGKFTVLYVGHVDFRKGVPYILEAAKSLCSKASDIEFVLVGPVRPLFKRLLSGYSDVCQVLGYVGHDRLAEIYSRADLFVFPSLEEGLALVQLEAMSHGLPVLSTCNAGAEEIIESGREGYILPLRDSAAIEERVLELYHDRARCRQMGEAAKKKALVQSWSNYAERLIYEYRALLQGS